MKVKEYVITSEEYDKAIKNEKIARDTIAHVMKLFDQVGHRIIVNHKELEHALIDGFEEVHMAKHTMTEDIVLRFKFKTQ